LEQTVVEIRMPTMTPGFSVESKQAKNPSRQNMTCKKWHAREVGGARPKTGHGRSTLVTDLMPDDILQPSAEMQRTWSSGPGETFGYHFTWQKSEPTDLSNFLFILIYFRDREATRDHPRECTFNRPWSSASV